MKQIAFLFAFLFVASLFIACEQDDPDVVNEEEVITTLEYTLSADGMEDVVLRFEDLDGDGGNAPTITGGTLAANTGYTGTIVLLNEQEDPAENITEEIEEEDLEHQFFFQTTVDGLSIGYTDKDANGDPLGLSTSIRTSDAGSGTLTVILRHEPDKKADGVSGGDITNAGGETDIEVSFDIDVQ